MLPQPEYEHLPLFRVPVAANPLEHGRAVVVEEGVRCFGWGSELAARLTEEAFDYLEAPIARVGSKSSPIGASTVLEDSILPSAQDVVDAVLEI